MNLNPEQQVASEGMAAHLRTVGDDPFFKLEGPAGTGKTFATTRTLLDFKRRVVVTAPTNKAVRVLREALKAWELKLECRTIYSLLGLKLEPNGEVKELTKPEDPVDLGDVAAVIVDEAFMLNKAIMGHIREASKRFPRLRWIFMGDPYQLPPIGELESPVASVEKGAFLSQIMRQDNQILKFSVLMRELIDKPFKPFKLFADNDGEEGIWMPEDFQQAIINQAGGFLKGENKAIAWRNATVDRLNSVVRGELFEDKDKYFWQQGDRVTLLEPAKDLEDEIIGTTDEEGAIMAADYAPHPVHGEFFCWRIVMRSDLNTSMTLWVLDETNPSNKHKFEGRKARLAATARADRREWKAYWSFIESFHRVRHAYAITAHRAQGSTYLRAFVNWKDILANPNRPEALRCLYVAGSRPKKELYLG